MAPTPSKSQAADGKLQLTQREIEVVAKAFRCITELKNGVAQVDSTKLAKIGGYASADSARHVWKPIQKKLIAMAGDAGDDDPSDTPAQPKTKSATRKRKNDVGDPEETPTKKPRKGKTVKSKVKSDNSDEDAAEKDLADGEA
ncbi:hypothetical protein GGS26DRAFT_567180 [Hypomontagnella submonticulosa]|nr:hypothetical protein GGS26DRAFT_567180 [Hypomontagnella submonticulosa]